MRHSDRRLYVLVPPSRLFAAHWSLFLPDADHDDPKQESSTGTRIHVVGDRLDGFRLEVVRGYDSQKDRSLQGRMFALAQVPQQYLQPCEASSESLQDCQSKDDDEGGGIISEEIRTPFEMACSEVGAPGPSLNRVSQQETAGERPGRRPKPEVRDCQWWVRQVVRSLVENQMLLPIAIGNEEVGEDPRHMIEAMPMH